MCVPWNGRRVRLALRGGEQRAVSAERAVAREAAEEHKEQEMVEQGESIDVESEKAPLALCIHTTLLMHVFRVLYQFTDRTFVKDSTVKLLVV